MEKSRQTAEEIAFALRRVEEETVLQVCRKMGVAEKTFYQSVQEGHGGWAWRRRNCGSWLAEGQPLTARCAVG